MQRRTAVIVYDIACNRRRYQVHRVLKAWGLPLQKSVFECQLDQHNATRLFQQLTQLLDVQEDSLLLTWLDQQRPVRVITVPQILQRKGPLWYEG